jgi:H+/Cl- antiporter ClcA
MRTRSWYVGAIVGLLAGLLAAIPVTIADWRLNPSGLFHDDQGTNWAIVAETAFSWFWPVALAAFVVTGLIHSWIFRKRRD